jgi:hypothetical protein
MDANMLHRLVIDNFLDIAQMRIVRQTSLDFSKYEIEEGHIPVVSVSESLETVHNLKLAISQGLVLTEANIASLAASGRLELLKYIKNNQLVMFYFIDPIYVDIAAWGRMTCKVAACGGHLETLKWLRENGCPWCELTCYCAAEGGHLETLQWARANGCPWDVFTCAAAAYGGHIDTLKWARKNGCPWDESTIASACEGGHIDVLKWAKKNGCPSLILKPVCWWRS